MRVFDHIGGLAGGRPSGLPHHRGRPAPEGSCRCSRASRCPSTVTAGNHESSIGGPEGPAGGVPAGLRARRETRPTTTASCTRAFRFVQSLHAGLGGEHIGTFTSENIQPRGQCEWLEGDCRRPRRARCSSPISRPSARARTARCTSGRNDSRWFNDLLRAHTSGAAFFGHLHSRPRPTGWAAPRYGRSARAAELQRRPIRSCTCASERRAWPCARSSRVRRARSATAQTPPLGAAAEEGHVVTATSWDPGQRDRAAGSG